eukprot:TRINITY_DN82328_c0_g1_i1.p1 TRINITY_DN82328_c0_g1~~TRINITY_DN82328_c0_g1_i1.p1  ORF type:complete len:287 (+),score=42.46 TRINITY_DN82328_c0_g1_i1:72-932(+)
MVFLPDWHHVANLVSFWVDGSLPHAPGLHSASDEGVDLGHHTGVAASTSFLGKCNCEQDATQTAAVLASDVSLLPAEAQLLYKLPEMTGGPEEWGPQAWHTLHSMASHLPAKLSPQVQQSFKDFMLQLPDLLPCKSCGLHLANSLQAMPMDGHLETREDAANWLVGLHNRVNHDLGKPELSYEEALACNHEACAGLVAKQEDAVMQPSLLSEAAVRVAMGSFSAAFSLLSVLRQPFLHEGKEERQSCLRQGGLRAQLQAGCAQALPSSRATGQAGSRAAYLGEQFL